MTKATDDEILESLIYLTNRFGFPPTLRELANEVGLDSVSSMHFRLEKLRSEGKIDFMDKKPRTLTVVI